MSTQKSVRQQFGTVEENPVRFDREKAKQIVEALNTDLASSYVLYHQLYKHHWNVEGAQYRDLHLFLEEAAQSAAEGADAIAERIQALGGVPVSGPAAMERHAPVTFEGEDVYDVRTSLENDLEMLGDIIETVREHVELTTSLGDHATTEILRRQLVELEDYAHEIEHFLAHDSLTEYHA